MFSVGAYYASGVGVAADTEAAVVWYKRAAAAGNVDAQFNLGVFYDSGNGVAVDAAAAFEWYTLAAEAGNVKAQFTSAAVTAMALASRPTRLRHLSGTRARRKLITLRP